MNGAAAVNRLSMMDATMMGALRPFPTSSTSWKSPRSATSNTYPYSSA